MPFQAGQSGNPGGRPKESAEIRALARQHSPKAFARIIGLIDSEDEKVAFNAAKEVLDRAYGKPAQSHTGEGGEGPIIVRIAPIDDRDDRPAIRHLRGSALELEGEAIPGTSLALSEEGR